MLSRYGRGGIKLVPSGIASSYVILVADEPADIGTVKGRFRAKISGGGQHHSIGRFGDLFDPVPSISA
ncbi:MAG: hypothetical protein GX307_07635 [Euryarchaeota archaeon]|nr:hypothetical protein [Euryarchaeota archaeon]